MRFFSWLPAAIEPEYADGFVCDKCGKECMKGALFHDDSTGTDYCLDCGDSDGLDTFCGLVSSLYFFSEEEPLRDVQTKGVALFCYRIDSVTLGIYFGDSSNVILLYDSPPAGGTGFDKPARISRVQSRKEERIPLSQAKNRFPWIFTFSSRVGNEVVLHPSCKKNFRFVDVIVEDFYADETIIGLTLSSEYMQIFDSSSGVEVVAKEDVAVAMFRNWNCVINEGESSVAQDIVNSTRVNN
ncbi:hypothetical protein AGDE_10272 [Angomonas deanei]|uniref:Uncharacterized protein n=1 Tax=Angomonas deanei TaxID=59799 RepID=A0A7G2CWF2_9TRYP|nr:hypothetical protein AGDE_10272 [Angomonas deanei]CAD2222582.1 hypothetical protein, conserved [Angomonas deanei]|eukprot:EPY28808.1 hypothetical protein AGDE_10272 [Angomonas deanei]